MSGVNKVILLGRLGQDPELKYTPSGVPVCKFSVATSESFTNKTSGEKTETTEWHNVVTWNKLAENCAKYLTKGRQAYVEGKLQTRSWDDKTSGQKRYATEIVANDVVFIGDASQKQAQQGTVQNAPIQEAPQNTASRTPPANLDDIPF